MNAKSNSRESWHVAKTIKPGHRGAVKLSRLYGEKLVCVRYRENADGTTRSTTVELIVDEVEI